MSKFSLYDGFRSICKRGHWYLLAKQFKDSAEYWINLFFKIFKSSVAMIITGTNHLGTLVTLFWRKYRRRIFNAFAINSFQYISSGISPKEKVHTGNAGFPVCSFVKGPQLEIHWEGKLPYLKILFLQFCLPQIKRKRELVLLLIWFFRFP